MVAPRLNDPLAADELREALDYNPATGVFTWRHRDNVPPHINARFSKAPAGHQTPLGYIAIKIKGRSHSAHRLAWLWVTGEWPAADTDHIDGDPSNNAWRNLRVASRSQNMMNSRQRTANVSGVKGVWFDKTCNMWRASVMVNYVSHRLGYFATIEEAKTARDAAAYKLHGEFFRG